MSWLAVALGGAMGACARFGLGAALTPLFGMSAAWATFCINLLGSFCIGALTTVLVEQGASESLRFFAVTGFLGAFTTYSAFSLDTLSLLQQGNYNDAFLLAAATLSLCLLATFCGYQLTKSFF